MTKLTKAQAESLSDDAMFFASSMFGIMETELTFRMIESKPSPRSQAALDELVKAGLVFVEAINQSGGITYRPLVSFPMRAKHPPGAWPVTVPIGRSALTEGK